MTYTYQWSLVAFSVFIAVFASYTTLRLASRMARATRRILPYWIVGGACSMGVGIWAMHFVGMLALHLPVPVAYDTNLTAFSVLPAILASAIALYALSRSGSSAVTRFIASVLMGLGIVTMHYSGMAAMQMSPPIAYSAALVALSVLIAVGASWGALVLVFREHSDTGTSFRKRLAGAVVMGLAVAGMHYTGMAAANFAPDSVCTVVSSGLGGGAIGLFVGIVAVLVVGVSLALTFFDELVGENSFFKALLSAQSDAGEGVLLVEGDRVIFANQVMESLCGYSETELKALPSWMDLVGGAGRELFLKGSAASASVRQTSRRTEIELTGRDGTSKTCEAVLKSFWHAQTTRHLLVCIDISNRKIAEEALRSRDAEARELALVASSTDNGVIIMDAKARISWVNEGFSRMCGYRLDEVLGRRPGDFLNGPETDPATLAFIQERIAKGERFETEIVHYDKSGRKYWAVIDVQAIHDESANTVKYISIERDITSRRLTDAALRESEVRLKEAQKLARLGNWELDLQSAEYMMSEEALRIHELTSPSGRVPQSAVKALISPQDQEKIRLAREQALVAGGRYAVEFSLNFPDGRIKHMQLRGAVHLQDAQGAPARVSGSIQDVTEQKLAENALLSLNETLEERVLERTQELDQQRTFIETILNTAETLIFVVDSRGSFVRFNGACERLTGYRFDELRDQPIWEYVITPERKEEVRVKHENQTNPDKLPRTLEVEWLTRAGARRLISWNNAVITDDAGRLKYMIGTGIDVTKRKRAEQALLDANLHLNKTISTLRETQSQLVQAEKMASLGGLVAGISHEINTPIGIGVTSATALQEEFVTLKRDFDGGTMKRSTLEHFISHGLNGCDILVRNLMRAADLIRSFKQVAVDQSSDDWREVNLHDYVDEIILSLKPKWKGRRILVTNGCDSGLTVYTHPGALYQILSNLLINSLLHAYGESDSGEIRISAESVGDEIQLDFEDDGKGIPAEIQDRIFDPFFTTRRGAGGSGLGLHIVFNLVASTLGGLIYLVKDAPKGATFRMTFPVVLESENS
jgi:PAS domain S-box-containing protein